MYTDTINILTDTLSVLDTLQVHFVENFILPDSSEAIISKIANSQNSTSNLALSVITTIISIFALIVSGLAFLNSRKHNIISVKPILIFRENVGSNSSSIKLFIQNKGVGPLTFNLFNIIYEDNIYYKMYDVFKIVKKKFGYSKDDFQEKFQLYTYPLANYSLKVGDEKNLLTYKLINKSPKESREFYSEIKKIKYHFEYTDLYGNTIEDDYQFIN